MVWLLFIQDLEALLRSSCRGTKAEARIPGRNWASEQEDRCGDCEQSDSIYFLRKRQRAFRQVE